MGGIIIFGLCIFFLIVVCFASYASLRIIGWIIGKFFLDHNPLPPPLCYEISFFFSVGLLVFLIWLDQRMKKKEREKASKQMQPSA